MNCVKSERLDGRDPGPSPCRPPFHPRLGRHAGISPSCVSGLEDPVADLTAERHSPYLTGHHARALTVQAEWSPTGDAARSVPGAQAFTTRALTGRVVLRSHGRENAYGSDY